MRKWQQANVIPYLEKAYQQFHGADPQGLKELKEMAVQSPLPPAGFAIKSAAEIERSKQTEFDSKHPELALWTNIKSALSASDGERYFASELKDSAVPTLEGVVVEATPRVPGHGTAYCHRIAGRCADFTPRSLVEI